jgi:hypothetical protein
MQHGVLGPNTRSCPFHPAISTVGSVRRLPAASLHQFTLSVEVSEMNTFDSGTLSACAATCGSVERGKAAK